LALVSEEEVAASCVGWWLRNRDSLADVQSSLYRIHETRLSIVNVKQHRRWRFVIRFTVCQR